MVLIKDDLPAPVGPSKPNIPLVRVRFMPLRAFTPLAYVLERFSIFNSMSVDVLKHFIIVATNQRNFKVKKKKLGQTIRFEVRNSRLKVLFYIRLKNRIIYINLDLIN